MNLGILSVSDTYGYWNWTQLKQYTVLTQVFNYLEVTAVFIVVLLEVAPTLSDFKVRYWYPVWKH